MNLKQNRGTLRALQLSRSRSTRPVQRPYVPSHRYLGTVSTLNEPVMHRSSREAFRNHCEYACALQIHRPRRLDVDEWIALVSVGLIALAWKMGWIFG